MRLMTLVATLTLGVAILFRSPLDYRMVVCVIVSVAATALAVRSLFTGKVMRSVLFLGVLGIFTPFQNSRFSHVSISVLDMATLALFAASPMILRESARPVVLGAPSGKF